jgi:negative regulator of flagellin synthesis FlgM
MAIDSISGRIPSTPAHNTKLATPTTTPDFATQTAASDKVNTPSADRIKSALGSLNEAPVNSERVANIKQAIRDGNYTVNAESVATKILQFERSLSANNA